MPWRTTHTLHGQLILQQSRQLLIDDGLDDSADLGSQRRREGCEVVRGHVHAGLANRRQDFCGHPVFEVFSLGLATAKGQVVEAGFIDQLMTSGVHRGLVVGITSLLRLRSLP